MFEQCVEHQFHVFVDFDPPPEMLRTNVKVIRVATTASVTEAAVANDSRKIGDILSFRRAVIQENLDVMYFPAVYSWYPTGGRVPSVITFHDAIAEHFPALVMPSFRGRLFWRAKTWLARRAATKLTTVSFAARQEIAEYFRIDPNKIAVILEAADPIFRPETDLEKRAEVRARLGIPAGVALILYVGGMAPHKNLIGLLRGYTAAAIAPALADVDLVFVGDPDGAGFHSNTQELIDLIADNPAIAKRVHFTGFVSDSDLVTLYSDAIAVAMPAFSEGFGLPAAEAIACCTPVIATRGGAVEEIVGPAGLFFDPNSIEEIAATITLIASDQVIQSRLKGCCLPRAAEMSWKKGAVDMLAVLATSANAR